MVVAAADQHLPSQIDHIFVFYQAAFKPAFCNPSIGHGGIIPRLSLRWEMNIRDTINFFVLTDTGTTRTPGREQRQALYWDVNSITSLSIVFPHLNQTLRW